MREQIGQSNGVVQPPAFPFVAMKHKIPPRWEPYRRSPSPRRSWCLDVFGVLVLALVALGCHTVWRAPAKGLKAKVAYVNREIREDWHLLRRALNGDFERENERLRLEIESSRAKGRSLEREVAAKGSEDASLVRMKGAIKVELSQVHQQEKALQRKLSKEDSFLETSQRDVVKAKEGSQGWRQKYLDSSESLSKAHADFLQERKQVQVAGQQLDKAEVETDKLKQATIVEEQIFKNLQASERGLRSQLSLERRQEHGLSSKVRHFKEAEVDLLKSLKE